FTLGGSSSLTGLVTVSGLGGTAVLNVQDSASINSSGALTFSGGNGTVTNASPTQMTVSGNASVSVLSLQFGDAGAQTRPSINAFAAVQDSASLTVSGQFNFWNGNTGTTVDANNLLNLNGGTTTIGSFITNGDATQANRIHLGGIHFNGGVLK